MFDCPLHCVLLSNTVASDCSSTEALKGHIIVHLLRKKEHINSASAALQERASVSPGEFFSVTFLRFHIEGVQTKSSIIKSYRTEALL